MEDWIELLAKHGVLASAHPPDKLRLVTHHHQAPDIIDEAIWRMRSAVAGKGAASD